MKGDSGCSWIVVLVICYFLYVGSSAAWRSKTRYALQYGVPDKDVHYNRRPHDCDFLAAPVGDKNCHYDSNVQYHSVLVRDNGLGYSVVSYDDGKTWQPNDGSAIAERYVMISWTRIDD